MNDLFRINGKAIAVGSAMIIGGLILISTLITVSWMAQRIPPEKVFEFQARWSFLLLLAPVLGGYVAASIAKRNELVHAFVVGAIAVVIFIGGFLAMSKLTGALTVDQSALMKIFEYALTVLGLTVVGGALRWVLRLVRGR